MMSKQENQYRTDAVISDYSSLNHAIDLEKSKADQLLEYYKHRKLISWARIALFAATAISLLVLAFAVAYYLLFRAEAPKAKAKAYDPSEERKIIEEIKEDDQKISSVFTVFIREQLATGETVVTGKSYTPKDTVAPFEQYCYLETIGGNRQEVGSNFLAEVHQNQVVYASAEEEKIRLAENYCRFELTDELQE